MPARIPPPMIKYSSRVGLPSKKLCGISATGRSAEGVAATDIDTDKIDEAVLALLQLALHDAFRAWKGHDWDTLGRLQGAQHGKRGRTVKLSRTAV